MKQKTLFAIPYSKLDSIPKVKTEILSFEKSVAYYESILSIRPSTLTSIAKKQMKNDLVNAKGILKTLKLYLKKLEQLQKS